MKQSIRWAVVAMGFLPLLAGKKAHSSGVVTAKVGKQLIQTDHANASIGNASLQNTSVNLMKKEAIVGFEGTTGPLGFEMILGGSTACRGSSPTDIESTYYTIATTNLDGCRTRCQRDVTCTGIGQPNANTCGNWKVPIEATTFGHGDICYVAHRRVLGQSSFASRIATGYLVFTHMDWGNVNTEFFTDLASATARFAELDGGAKAAGMYEADFTELKFYGSQKDAIVKDFYKTFTSTKLLPEAKAGSSPVEGFNGMLGNKLSTLLHGGKVAWEQTGLAAATFFGRGLAGMANGASPFLGPVASISSTLLDNLMSKSQENDYIFQTSPFLLKTVKEMVGMKDVEGGPLGSINGRVAAALKGFSSKLGLASSVAPVGGNVRLSQSMLLEAEATELQARLLEKCYSAAYSCYSAEGQGDHMKSQANSIAWSSCDRIQEECKTNMNAGIAFVLQEVAASHFATIADLLSLMPQGSITDEVLVDTFNAVGCPNPAPDTTNWKDTLDAVPDNAKVLQEMFNLCEQTALGTASEEDKKQCCVTSCTPVCVKQTGFFYRGQAAVESLLHKLKKIRGEYRSALTRARYHHLAKRISQVACGADRKCREIDGVSEFTTLPDSISNTDGVSMLGHPNVRIFKKGLTQQVLTKLQKGDNLVNDRVAA
ncbi:unnamed protein product [Symbiodinium natans]|uniref:Uncharacterized protein n=1 Tax=Symbiodinium natans TaxID=878477 RepID=A0A812J546_9DINO|nr:unnamed protein product [Symbiodinium natans]